MTALQMYERPEDDDRVDKIDAGETRAFLNPDDELDDILIARGSEEDLGFSQKLLDAFTSMTGIRRRRRRGGHVDVDRGATRQNNHAHVTRASVGTAALRKSLTVVPVVILMCFGALHLIQAFLSGMNVFWDQDYDDFLPNWGHAGHVGEFVARYPTDATRDIVPIPCHSHNDYWRRIPLFEAIHYGLTGVEADVWHINDDLLVGHNKASLTANRTFQSLYVNPLVELLDKQNPKTVFDNATGHGVFDTDQDQTLVLLVDFKTDGHDLWPIVRSQLEPLRKRGYLTHWDGKKVKPGAVTVVGTGNTPFDLVIANTTYRDVFFDAPLDKVSRSGKESRLRARQQGNNGVKDKSPDDFNPGTSYYASISMRDAIGPIWKGRITPSQLDIIRDQIRGAQKRGLKVRYWDTPNWPIGLRNHVWEVLINEGVDMLNVDDLKSAARRDWKRLEHHLL